MRKHIALGIALSTLSAGLLCAILLKHKKTKYPTADEIAQDILKDLDEETKYKLSQAEPDSFGDYSWQYHFTLGMQIRNKYNLWERPDIDPDDFSGAIINRLIYKINDMENKRGNWYAI